MADLLRYVDLRVRIEFIGTKSYEGTTTSGQVQLTKDLDSSIEGADVLAIVTEWKEFRAPDFDAIKAALKTPAIFDGRNLYEPAHPRAAGLEYFSIGRK